MDYNVKVDNETEKYGYVTGSIEDFQWFALVHQQPVDYGIQVASLQKGGGRIARLCIYKDVDLILDTEDSESIDVVRYVYADYKHEWEVLSGEYLTLIETLVRYLDRRYSIALVK